MKLTKEQQLLVENNLGIVYFCVDKYFSQNFYYIEREELINEGLYWLCKCVVFYDEDKGKFSTFAIFCIKKHLQDYLQKFYKKRVETVEYEECKNLGYLDTYNIDITEDLKEFLRTYLSEKYAEMTIDYYFNNLDWEEIAKKYGYSNRKSACAVIQDSLKKIGENKHLRNKCYNLFV